MDNMEKKGRDDNLESHGAVSPEQLLDLIPSAVLTVDPDQRISSFNREAERLTGYSAGESIGRKCTLFAQEPCTQECGLFAHSTETPIFNRTCTIIRKDGEVRTISKNADLLKDECGKVVGGIETFVDITERKEKERALERYQYELEELVQERSKEVLKERDLIDNILKSLPGVFYLFDIHGKIEKWNTNFEKVTEYSTEEIAKMHPLDFFKGKDQENVAERIMTVFEEGVSEVEAELFTKSGKKIPHYFTGYQFEIEGQPHLIGVGLDISERTRAQEEVAEARRFLASSLSSTPLGVVLLDGQGKFSYVNPTFLNLLNRKEGEFIGKGVKELAKPLFPPRTLEIIAERVGERLRTGAALADAEVEVLNAAGERIPISYSASGIKSDKGEVIGEVVFITDIRARKQVQERVEKLNRTLEERVRQRTMELESANKELEAFAYSVSHDLRAPLRSLDGFSQAVLEDYHEQLDEEGRDFLLRIRHASQRMGRLIDDLLKLSRLTRREMSKGYIDLSALARKAANDLRDGEPAREAEFSIMEELKAHADPALFAVVLENLLGNAWKYTSKKPSARIAFGKTDLKGEEVYYLEDNGAGFDMAYVDKLFGPFQRLHKDTEFPGTGIGLATVQRIIGRHGGRIWAEGAVDQGATFYFTLPHSHEQRGN